MIGYAQLSGPSPLSKNPQFVSLKAKVDSTANVADKLLLLDVTKGLYNPFAPAQPDKNLQIRTVLTILVLADAAEKAGLHQDVECVLRAALAGVPDESYYGMLVPTGAAIQRPEICATKMTIEQALEAFKKPYPEATAYIAQGIAAAVPAKYKDYKAKLTTNFKKRFVTSLNPFENPFTKNAAYIALGVVGLIILSRIGRR